MASCGACTPTHSPYDYIMTLHLEKNSSKLVILLSICAKGLSGLGRFDSINSYFYLLVMGLVTCLVFQSHCSLFHWTCTEINIHTYIYMHTYTFLSSFQSSGKSKSIHISSVPTHVLGLTNFDLNVLLTFLRHHLFHLLVR